MQERKYWAMVLFSLMCFAFATTYAQTIDEQFEAELSANGNKTGWNAQVKLKKYRLMCKVDNGAEIDLKLNQVHARTKRALFDGEMTIYEGSCAKYNAEVIIFYTNDGDIEAIVIEPYTTTEPSLIFENPIKKL